MRIDAPSPSPHSAVSASRASSSGTTFSDSIARARRQPGGESGALERIVREVDASSHAMSQAMRRMQVSAAMSNEELLAVQLTFYRHSQMIDVAAKAVEKVSSGLRQLAQNS